MLIARPLVQYFTKFADLAFCGQQNKIRKKSVAYFLDSKDEGDKKLSAGAPKFAEYLNEPSRAFFKDVLSGIEKLGIPYNANSHLVHGLDYYCHTVFEFTTAKLGAQGTVLVGGRYDGLIETMGGPKTLELVGLRGLIVLPT